MHLARAQENISNQKLVYGGPCKPSLTKFEDVVKCSEAS